MKSNSTIKLFFVIFMTSCVWLSCSGPDCLLHGTWTLSGSKINEILEEQYTPVTWTFKSNSRFVQIMNGPDGPIERAGEYNYDTAAGELHLHFDHGSNRHVRWAVVALDKHSLEVEYTGYGFFVERKFIRK